MGETLFRISSHGLILYVDQLALSLCRHSGNQGTTGRPARAHNTLQKILLRTRLSNPGEPREGFLPREGPLLERASRMLGEDQAKRLGEASSLAEVPSSLAGFLPLEASSVSATERTWALRPPQSHGRAKAR